MFTMGYMTILLEIVQISGFEVFFFVIKTKRFITFRMQFLDLCF